jgi:hypothetical protein
MLCTWHGLAAPAHAKESGFPAEGCEGCHRAGKEPGASIALTPSSLGLGQTVRLSISIDAVNGSKAGLYLQATQGLGTLKLVAGEPTKLTGSNGVVHSTPKQASGNKVTFLVDWVAPNQPDGVEFRAYVLSANGDRSSSGDGAGFAYTSLAFGCTPNTFYPDRDGDGDGASDGEPRMGCSAPMYFSATHGDCNDFDQRVLSGASEVCNGVDDDCDAQIDEGLPVSSYCEDKDGDGHGVRSQLTSMGCRPAKGFGVCDSDCNDADPGMYPGAQELCNYKDDNCNERVDDGAKQTCGEGWCRRASESCASSLCTPGAPRAEQCNAFDDDCDGVIDNGAGLCGAGKSCLEGVCLLQPDAGSVAGSQAGGIDPAESEAGMPPLGNESGAEPGQDTPASDAGCALSGSRICSRVEPRASTPRERLPGFGYLLLLAALRLRRAARGRERRVSVSRSG